MTPPRRNPCRSVRLYKKNRCGRFLTPEEYRRLGRVLDEAETQGGFLPSGVAAIRLLLLTGCRKNEIITLRWDDIARPRWSTGLELFGAAMPHGGGPCKSSPRAPTSAPFASCSGKRPARKWRNRSLPPPMRPRSFWRPAESASCDGLVPGVGRGEAFARFISSMRPSIC